MLHDLTQRDDSRGAQEKKFEECKFCWGEPDPDAGPLSPTPVLVEFKICADQQELIFSVTPADQRAHTGQQFADGKGLHRISVYPSFRPVDMPVHRGAGCEHQYRRVHSPTAQLSAHLHSLAL